MEKIKSFILKKIQNHPRDIVIVTAEKFGVTRTTVHRHLSNLIRDNKIIKTGTTKQINYYIASSFDKKLIFKRSQGLDEFEVFNQYLRSDLTKFPKNIYKIIDYGFTEIFNNAIDHAHCKKIIVECLIRENLINVSITDDGIGIFRKISTDLKLVDFREAILQLSKGKFTSDPMNHSGEGIFFSSRAFEKFSIKANGIYYCRDNIEQDWFIGSSSEPKHGTQVLMQIRKDSRNDLVSVFKSYQNVESLAFDKTEIIVELSKLNQEIFMSRSQAKRILLGLEKFERIVLDFKHVSLVGQGFVDEIFRVYQNKRPTLEITYRNANDDVCFMIERGKAYQ